MIRMLIIEDDAEASEWIQRVLRRAGVACTLERVETEAAFRLALGRSPDLILSDSNVPGFDGWAALAIARAECPGTPFVFVTGQADPAAARTAQERGAAGFVAKSELARLADVVRSLLENRDAEAREDRPGRRRADADTDASSTATYLLERQAILDRALRDEDHSTLSSILRRHPPVPVALLSLTSVEVRERFVKWLRNANIEIECAASATDALVALEQRTHALLFTDRLELAQAVRQLHAGSATHVVFVDVDGKVGAREALRRGANDCMPPEASGGEEFWAHLTTARRIASLSSALQLALTDNRILSTIDELTRCGSRRFFEHEFPREIARALRLRRALSLVICDIDHFKAVNDAHGHEAGDEVLQEFAARLTHGLRLGEDWVARIGGEEFAVVLPEVAGAEALQIAQRLCERVRAAPYTTAAGALRVTGSFGVSGFEPNGHGRHISSRALVKAADAALYESKRAGRNRVTALQPH
ncbi:MAG TPA: GGDEF domain-containing response regulator [Steroidobacteraceae bacterium]|nr:GGDEF domain-containing response regulator [Steroidobacteraceae bacterium]